MQQIYKNLRVRNATPEDAMLLSAWWNDGSIMEHAGFHNGTGETPDMIANRVRKDSDMTCRRLIIEEEAPGHVLRKGDRDSLDTRYQYIPIGEMSYQNVGHRIAEIGIKICNVSRQNKGYGHIVLSMLIIELFQRLHFSSIILDTNITNERAHHVYEALGFERVGVQERAFRDSRGNWRTSVHYKLTPENFHSFL